MPLNTLTDLRILEGTICDEPMNPRARITMFKRREAKEPHMSTKVKKEDAAGGADPTAALEGLTPEQKDALAQLLAAKDEQIASLQQAKADPAPVPPSEDEAAKAAKAKPAESPEIAKARAEVAEIKKQLDTERNARLDREYADKARAFTSIPVKTEELAKLLRAVGEHAPEQSATLEKTLRACDSLAVSGGAITKSLGVANGVEKGGSAREEIEEVAAKAMASNPKLSKSSAIAKAWKDRPDLVTKHREESSAQA